MKKVLFFATALLALASCTSDDFVGETPRPTNEAAISFGFDVPTPTRSEGTAAATALSNQFIVWGEKDETPSAAADGKLVFKNYLVQYTEPVAEPFPLAVQGDLLVRGVGHGDDCTVSELSSVGDVVAQYAFTVVCLYLLVTDEYCLEFLVGNSVIHKSDGSLTDLVAHI